MIIQLTQDWPLPSNRSLISVSFVSPRTFSLAAVASVVFSLWWLAF